jgi:hypothetical protein
LSWNSAKALNSPNGARSDRLTDHLVCLCALMREDIVRTMREQIGEIVVSPAADVIRRLVVGNARRFVSQLCP